VYAFDGKYTDNFYAKSLGFRAVDLPKLLYDLTPYSFVVDWFADVGSWISACTPNPACIILGSWNTIVEESLRFGECSLRTYQVPETQDGHPRWFSGFGGGESTIVTDVSRYCGVTVPGHPTMNLDLTSLSHAVSGLSLLLQRVNVGLQKIHF
jgi:hypothetical protein